MKLWIQMLEASVNTVNFRPFQGQLQQWRSELQGKWPQQWLSQRMSSTPSTKRSLLSSLWVCPRPRIKGIEDVVLVDAPSAALQTCKVHGTYCTLMLFIEGMSHSWIIWDRQPATIQHYSSSSIRSLRILGVKHTTENIQKRWKYIIIQSYLHPHSSRPPPNESQQKCRRKFELKTLQRNQLPPNRAVEMQEKQLEGSWWWDFPQDLSMSRQPGDTRTRDVWGEHNGRVKRWFWGIR